MAVDSRLTFRSRTGTLPDSEAPLRLLLPLLALGCAGDDILDTDGNPVVSGCEVGPEPTLEVGKGEEEWAASDEDEGRSILIHGVQGGFHTFVSVRAAHLSLDGPWQLRIRGYLDGYPMAYAELERDPACNEEADVGESIGTWLIWWGRPPHLHGREAAIDARVTDVDGRSVLAGTRQIIWDEELWDEQVDPADDQGTGIVSTWSGETLPTVTPRP